MTNTTKKTKEAYRAIVQGQKIYFSCNLAGFDKARQMAHSLNQDLPLKYCRVAATKKLIGE